MVHYDGSVIGATATAMATAVRTQAQTVIPTHPNWTLVESTTMNAGAVPCDVYKCSGVGNGIGVDFYFALMQSGPALYVGLAEGYNTSTHKPQRPAMHAPAALQTLQADGGLLPAGTEIDWYNGTYNPGGGACSVNPPQIANYVLLVDDYKIYVGADVVVISQRSASLFGGVSVFDSMVPSAATNDPFPVHIFEFGNSVVHYNGSTRHPLNGGKSIGYACNMNGTEAGGYFPNSALNPYGYGAFTVGSGVAADNSDLYAGGAPVGRFVLLMSYVAGSATVGRDKNGYLRGVGRHLRAVGSAVSGLTWGDTVTIDGVAYTYLTATVYLETNPA